MGDSKKQVAAYCRVSTDSEEQLTSYAAQKEYYTQKIMENPDWQMAGVFADRGISGTSLKKRTEFNRMIAACKRGRIDLILTKSLSRFARNTVDCLEIVRMLKSIGIGVIFEKENINTLTASSEFLITLFSGFAQAESESLSRNVSWGRQKSMEAGRVALRFQTLLGYRKGADGRAEIDPEEAETVRRIYRRYLEGCSLEQIRRELEADGAPTASGITKWSRQVVQNILKNEKYIGDVLLQKTYVTDCISKTVRKNNGDRPMYYIKNNHPAIIPEDIFYRVREEMTRRSSKRKIMQKTGKTEQGKYSSKYALSELLVCGECGAPYKRCTWSRDGKKRIVWRCVSRLEFGKKYCRRSPTLDEGDLHRAVLSAINDKAAGRDEISRAATELINSVCFGQTREEATLLSMQSRLDEITAQQTELLDKVLELEDMDNTAWNARLQALTEEKQSLLKQMETMQTGSSRQTARQTRMDEVADFIRRHADGFTEYNDEITRRVVEKITVLHAQMIRIKYRDADTEVDRSFI